MFPETEYQHGGTGFDEELVARWGQHHRLEVCSLIHLKEEQHWTTGFDQEARTGWVNDQGQLADREVWSLLQWMEEHRQLPELQRLLVVRQTRHHL